MQIAMDLAQPPSYAHDDFIVSDSNRAVYDLVMQWPHWPGPHLWVYGPPASGKTHLASIWSERAEATTCLETNQDIDSELLFAGSDALFVDLRHDQLSEEQQFHLINYAKNHSKSILWVDEVSPARKAIDLPDLSSRIKAMPAIEMGAPDDHLLHALMIKQLTDKQLRISPDVVHYLLKRVDRSCEAVIDVIDRLDRKAIEEQRSVTLPFVKYALRESPYIVME